MTIFELAKICNVNTVFYVRDELRETDVEMGTAAMIVKLGLGSDAKIIHINAEESKLYIEI